MLESIFKEEEVHVREFAVRSFLVLFTRGTPRVQFANIRKMVLCQGLPHCLPLSIDPCMARHAQSLSSSLHA